MWSASAKKAIRLAPLALLLGCLCLFITVGQASAATLQASAPVTPTYNPTAPTGCDAWNPYVGICYHWTINVPSVPVGCTAWNAQTQVCTAWAGNTTFKSIHSHKFTLRTGCASWNSKLHLCTRWHTSND